MRVDARSMGVRSNNRSEETVRSFFRKVFDIDMMKAYSDLKDVGRVPVDRLRDKQSLAECINSAPVQAMNAIILYLKAKKMREQYEVECLKTMRHLKRVAMMKLELHMKEFGYSRKQITKDMIEEEIAACPETSSEFLDMKERLFDLRGVEGLLEALARRWAGREISLQTQAKLIT